MSSDSTQMLLQQQQLAAILGPDPSHFETLISHLLSSSNEQRSQAESNFNLIKQTDPNSLALKLAQLVTDPNSLAPKLAQVPVTHPKLLPCSPLEYACSFSAILLRNQFTWRRRRRRRRRWRRRLWPRLSNATQSTIRSTIKSLLLTVIQNENSKSIIKTISELASSILPDNEWPKILPFMFQCVTSNNPKLQKSAFLIFSQLAQDNGHTLVPYIDGLHTVFQQGLIHSTSPDVRISSLSAVINFIQFLNNSTDGDGFRKLLRHMKGTLTEAFRSSQVATAQEALELWIELAGTEPWFLRWDFWDVVYSMSTIAKEQSLEEGTRHLAIELVITLAEAGMWQPVFIWWWIPILMNMLLDIEDVPEWHSAVAGTEDAGESNNYSVAKESLYRLAIALGGNTIVPVACRELRDYLAASEWQKHHAALIALAQIAEGCSEEMITNLEQVVNMVLNSFQDPHPRVRWAAINAIGQLSTDLAPDLQVRYHHRVLPALESAMDDFQNRRVQAHAASAMFNFVESCDPVILGQRRIEILCRLLQAVQRGVRVYDSFNDDYTLFELRFGIRIRLFQLPVQRQASLSHLEEIRKLVTEQIERHKLLNRI